MAKKITKQINAQFIPTNVGGYPVYAYGGKMQYGFGSWLQDNAGTIGTVAGAGLGTLVGMPGIGASIGGKIGSTVENNYGQDQLLQQQQLELQKQNTIKNLPGQPTYVPTFADGGYMNSIKPIFNQPNQQLMPIGLNRMYDKTNSFNRRGTTYFDEANKLDNQMNDYRTQLGNENLGLLDKNKAQLGINTTEDLKFDLYNNQLDNYANGGPVDNITDRISSFEKGGSHSENPNGGIKVGQNALTEEGEVMFTNKKGEKYIFSDKF